MNLPNTFLTTFERSQEPFLIHRGRFYTLERPQGDCSSEDYLFLGERKFPLERSEKINSIEHLYFRKHHQIIFEQMREIVEKEFIEKLDQSSKELFNKKNIYEQCKDSEMDLFIKQEVIPKYKKIASKFFDDKTITIDDIDITPENIESEVIEFDQTKLKIPGIKDLFQKRSCLDEILKGESLFMVASICYTLPQEKTDLLEEFVNIGFTRRKLAPNCNVKELEQQYKISLTKLITATARKHGEILLPMIKGNQEKIKQLESSIKKEKKQEFGTVGYLPLEGNKYRVYVKIEPYIIKIEDNSSDKKERYFKFDETSFGTDIRIANNNVEILAVPKILQPEKYVHPFTYGDNNVCYGHNKRWEMINVSFGRSYPLDTKENRSISGRKVALVLGEGWKVLHKGYISREIHEASHPVSVFKEKEISKEESLNSGLKIY